MAFCPHCGNRISEGAVFCRNCGGKIEGSVSSPETEVKQTAPEPVPQEPTAPEPAPPQPTVEQPAQQAATPQPAPQPAEPQPELAPQPAPQQEAVPREEAPQPAATPQPAQPAATPQPTAQKGKSSLPLIIGLILALIAAAAAAFFFFLSPSAKFDRGMKSVESQLSSGDYEQALTTLENLDVPDNISKRENFQKAYSIATFQPEVDYVEQSWFPAIFVHLATGSKLDVTTKDITITENGVEQKVDEVLNTDGEYIITYFSTDEENESGPRNIEIKINASGYEFDSNSSYDPPPYRDADIILLSTDISSYPEIKTYFAVRDMETSEDIKGLTATSFVLEEKITGGKYLAREIKSVNRLEGNVGVNISLVADKSSSIYYDDMEAIKTVMSEFVDHLDFKLGDKAEVIAFDDIVQQMCTFTNDKKLLHNGIGYMSPDGMTALYDALYSGINHAMLRGGPRCVIAFTDGEDNASNHTPAEVIRYANSCQVPVYIIGVGSSIERYTLMDIADSTNGRYWDISDLYDLEDIYREIYSDQMELYEVIYTSDSSAKEDESRELQISIKGGGHKGTTTTTFTPNKGLSNVKHDSRYELVHENLTWEQASQRCEEMGGHLATITDQAEMDEIINLMESKGAKYCWLGGYTSYDFDGKVFGHWVTGEEFSFAPWGTGEPSRVDTDGVSEWYIMLWNIPKLGGWTWNDQCNDPVARVPEMKDGMCFVCEYED